jgi:uncharacterized membrane protein YfhO
VDGEEQRIYPANVAFRAVALPEGASRVVFEYRPLDFTLGATGSGAAVLAWFLMLGLVKRRFGARANQSRTVTHT